MMASLHVSHDLGLHKKHASTNQFKIRACLHTAYVSFSSYTSRLDALSLRLSESVHRPICHIPYTHNVFKCQSFLIPGQPNDLPILKTAVTAVARSFKLYCGNPLVLQLVPPVSIIAFTVWGSGPLMRYSRNLFFCRSDSSWQRSSTRFILISYLQPLLLWTGATLVCRALDPIILPSEASQIVKRRLLNFVRSLSTVLASAYCLSSLIQQTQKFFMETNDSKDTRNMGFQFAGKALYTAVWVAAVALFMELLGFSTQKWLTAGGLGTVLLTLAGREIFTNFLSSVMIHATRPFIVNEWIQTKIEGYAVSGIVEHVGWWSPTIIRGEDREAVHIPNHQFTVNVVRNLSQKTHWRIKTHLAISHLDVSKINSIVADMRKVLAKNPQVEQQRLHRRVFLENINPENQALMILISCFVKTSHIEEYLCVKEAILLDLLRVISHHRARLATPIRTVQNTYNEADIDNIPFSETIYSRPRAPNNRPLLLIEPSYKINSDDKSRYQARPTRKSEESDTKVITPSSSKTEGKVAEESAESVPQNKVTGISQNSRFTSKDESSALSEPKVDDKVTVSPPLPLSSNAKTDPTVAAKPAADYHGLGSVPDGSLNKSRELEKVGSGDTLTKGGEVDSTQMKITASAAPVPDFEVAEAARVTSHDNSLIEPTVEKCSTNPSHLTNAKADSSVSSAMLEAEQENEKRPPPSPISRPGLENNIVLGVALEGSKRTLPIEEGTIPSPASGEEQELATCRNGNGLAPTEKDNKDGQISGGIQRQRDQER